MRKCSYRVARDTCCEVDPVKDVDVVRRWDVVVVGCVSVRRYGGWAMVDPGPDFSGDVVGVEVVAVCPAAAVAKAVAPALQQQQQQQSKQQQQEQP